MRRLIPLVLVWGCAPGDHVERSANVEPALDSIAQEVLTTGPVAGLSVAVMRGSETIYSRGHGSANVESGLPATNSTVYVAASVSTFFTAYPPLLLGANLLIPDLLGSVNARLAAIGGSADVGPTALGTVLVFNTALVVWMVVRSRAMSPRMGSV